MCASANHSHISFVFVQAITISLDKDVPREVTTPIHFVNGKVKRFSLMRYFLAKADLFLYLSTSGWYF